ncbi:MAG: hypothetical protein WCK31_01950 [bacterium]
MKYIIKSNYNTSLFHVIDSISKWDEHVDDHNYTWFKKRFYLSQEDKELLLGYSTYRKKLGWNKESELLNWAFNGYRGTKHRKIWKAIEHFENKKSRSGKLLSEYLFRKQAQISKYIPKIESKFKMKKYNINSLVIISPKKKKYKEIQIFLTPSFDKYAYQAGANGYGIIVELPGRIREREIMSVLMHELFHKVGRLREYFARHPNKRTRKFLKKINKNTLYSNNADILDEIFAYSLTNHYINKENPGEKIRNYKKLSMVRERNYMVNIWKGVKMLAPRIINFLQKKSEPEIFVNEMVYEYRKELL